MLPMESLKLQKCHLNKYNRIHVKINSGHLFTRTDTMSIDK